VRHQNLLGIALHRARGTEVVANRLTQFLASSRIAIAQQRLVERPQAPRAQLAPLIDSPCIDQRSTEIERPLVGQFRDVYGHPRPPARRTRRTLTHFDDPCAGEFGKLRGNIGTRTDLSVDAALRQELLISQDHHGARDRQVFRELARRGQLCPRPQRLRQDRRSQLEIDLAEQRRARRALDLRQEWQVPSVPHDVGPPKVVWPDRRKWLHLSYYS